jgi:hypothetical protein
MRMAGISFTDVLVSQKKGKQASAAGVIGITPGGENPDFRNPDSDICHHIGFST